MSECDKTKTTIYCDLLKATWLNFKNSEEILFHNLKNTPDVTVKETINFLHNDVNDVDKIHTDIFGILQKYDQEIFEINQILLNKMAPTEVISSNELKVKFQWVKRQLETEIEKLKQLNCDYEDKNASLAHENHEIHSEFKSYMYRMQPISEQKKELLQQIEALKIQNNKLEEKLAASENSNLCMKSTIENHEKEISELKQQRNKNENEKILQTTINGHEKLNKMISIHNDTDSTVPYMNHKDSCPSCQKYLNKINKLVQDLEDVNNRYSAKREKHRQKLIDARSNYLSKIEQIIEQNNNQKEQISNLTEKLRINHLRLQKITHEKNQLSSRILPLEDELSNEKNKNIIYQNKIEKLENHMHKVTRNICENMLVCDKKQSNGV